MLVRLISTLLSRHNCSDESVNPFKACDLSVSNISQTLSDEKLLSKSGFLEINEKKLF